MPQPLLQSFLVPRMQNNVKKRSNESKSAPLGHVSVAEVPKQTHLTVDGYDVPVSCLSPANAKYQQRKTLLARLDEA